MTTHATLTARQSQVLTYIDEVVRHRGYPPSVREIGEAVGLSSSSTVHAHLAALQDKGYLRRDPSKPRAIEVTFDPTSGNTIDRRPVRHVPLIGDVAAGTGVLAAEHFEESMPLPSLRVPESSLLSTSRSQCHYLKTLSGRARSSCCGYAVSR